MSFFGPESSSLAVDSRDASTDQSRIIRGNSNSYADVGSILLRDKASLTSPGALNLSGASLKVDKGSTLTITNTNSNVPADFFTKFFASQSDELNAVASANAAALAKVSDLAKSTANDGTGGQNKFTLYVLFGVLALLGWFFYKK